MEILFDPEANLRRQLGRLVGVALDDCPIRVFD
jgi:hypothetical protein